MGEVTDKRLLRGARTRERVLDQAVDIASLEGLSRLSFAGVAAQAGLSKAGVQTLFKTKEALQLATVERARVRFVAAVVTPAQSADRGVARLRSLVEHWIVYAEAPLFAGGCFRVANLAEFDSSPGPVRDALVRDQRDWVATIAGELRNAVAEGEIGPLDPDLAAFQLDAVLCAANTTLRIGDRDAVSDVRRTVDGLLARPS